jgi:matrixin
MSLTFKLRGPRVAVAVLACAGLALSPAVADAATKAKPKKRKQPVAVREARGAKPTGVANRIGLSASAQLAALNTGIKAGPGWFAGTENGCGTVTPMLTSQPGSTLAGNFRDAFGDCYVWLNLGQSSMLTGGEICKLALHEMGHLAGLEHSGEDRDVMFAPFRSDPIPAPCAA